MSRSFLPLLRFKTVVRRLFGRRGRARSGGSFLPALAIIWVIGAMLPRVARGDTTLLPVADTYVRSDQGTTAFGAVSTIESNNANGVRVMLLRFDLGGVTVPVTHLHLDLTVVVGSNGNTFQVFGLAPANNGWNEATVSWSTAPGTKHSFTGTAGVQTDYLNSADFNNGGTALATFSSKASGVVTAFDVTAGPVLNFVNANLGGTISLLIAEADPSDTSGDRYNSREAASGRPTLTLSSEKRRNIRVVLVGGQSNADGRAPGSGLPANLQTPQANVPFYYYTYSAAANSDGTLGTLTTLRPGATQMPTGGFGPEVALGSNLAPVIQSEPNTTLALIKYARGNTSLYGDWNADGTANFVADTTVYQAFEQVVRNGLASLRAANPNASVSLAGMIWVQGEADLATSTSTASAYAANLTRFITDVRATFSPTLPFFLSRISSRQTHYSDPSSSYYQGYLILRDQQSQVVANVPNTYLIDTDDSAFTVNSDYLHFSADGQQALGAAFARAMTGVLHLQTTVQTQSNGISLQWNGVPSKRYRVGTSSDLKSWSDQDVGAVSSWMDTAPGTRRFYRVLELDDTL